MNWTDQFMFEVLSIQVKKLFYIWYTKIDKVETLHPFHNKVTQLTERI